MNVSGRATATKTPMSSSDVAALFVRRDSPYRTLGCDLWDASRDARRFPLDRPVIAHPPCRAWGRFRAVAKPRADERDLALFAVWAVRLCGGVVEHPASSGLWRFFGLRPGVRDEFGGVLVVVDQSAYGHEAQKRTGLYCVGGLPDLRVDWGGLAAVRSVESMCTAQRERTPLPFARVLVELARGARVSH